MMGDGSVSPNAGGLGIGADESACGHLCAIQSSPPGGVAERLKAPVLKTGNARAFVGSNPTLSAILIGSGRAIRLESLPGPDTMPVGNSGGRTYPLGPRGEVAEWLKARPC